MKKINLYKIYGIYRTSVYALIMTLLCVSLCYCNIIAVKAVPEETTVEKDTPDTDINTTDETEIETEVEMETSTDVETVTIKEASTTNNSVLKSETMETVENAESGSPVDYTGYFIVIIFIGGILFVLLCLNAFISIKNTASLQRLEAFEENNIKNINEIKEVVVPLAKIIRKANEESCNKITDLVEVNGEKTSKDVQDLLKKSYQSQTDQINDVKNVLEKIVKPLSLIINPKKQREVCEYGNQSSNNKTIDEDSDDFQGGESENRENEYIEEQESISTPSYIREYNSYMFGNISQLSKGKFVNVDCSSSNGNPRLNTNTTIIESAKKTYYTAYKEDEDTLYIFPTGDKEKHSTLYTILQGIYDFDKSEIGSNDKVIFIVEKACKFVRAREGSAFIADEKGHIKVKPGQN